MTEDGFAKTLGERPEGTINFDVAEQAAQGRNVPARLTQRNKTKNAVIQHDLSEVFRRFIKDRAQASDRKPLRSKTRRSYHQAHDAFRSAFLGARNEAQLNRAVHAIIDERVGSGKMSRSGMNVYIRGVNSFFSWCYKFKFLKNHIKIGVLCTERRKPFRRLGQKDIPVWKNFNAVTLPELRAKHMALLGLDAGARAHESLTLRLRDIDWKGSRIWISRGKGGANREVPLSEEGKKSLRHFLALTSHCRSGQDSLIFCTKGGSPVSYRNALRDLKKIARHLGSPWVSWHSFRRTFATQYIRNGGLLTDLQQILGHTDIRTTILYLGNSIDDIVALHDEYTPLSPARKRRQKWNGPSAGGVGALRMGGFRKR